MKKNMGTIDIALRLVIAAIVFALYFTGVSSGIVGIVLMVLGGVFILTSLIRFCPLYIPFRINTTGKKETSNK